MGDHILDTGASTGGFLLAGGLGVLWIAKDMPGVTGTAMRAAGGAVAVFGALGLARALKNSARTGGIAGGIVDALIGTPSAAGLDEVEAIDAAQFPSLGPGVHGRFLEPLSGGAVGRNRLFGNEYPFRVELVNNTDGEVSFELVVSVREKDLAFTSSVPLPLGRVVIPAHSGLRGRGTLTEQTSVVIDLAGGVLVEASLLADGALLEQIRYTLR